MTPEATGLITITSVPRGEAPEEIRAAWVGLTLPCYPIAGHLAPCPHIAGSEDACEMGVLSGEPRTDQRSVVIVPQAEALAILGEHVPEAAQWWSDHGFPNPVIPNFSFGEDEVTFVSGVTRQPVVVIEDDMQGDPYR